MVISKNSKLRVFHRDWCPYEKKIGKKYRKNYTLDQVRSKGYRECSWCGGAHGAYLSIRDRPDPYWLKTLNGVGLSYDPNFNGVCLKTDKGFWKAIFGKEEQQFKLWHLNECCFDPSKSDKELAAMAFHRQKDVAATKNIWTLIKYVVDHDKAKRIMDEDWRKLPRGNQKQRDYYNKKKKKERWKSIKRVDEIFRQLEAERKEK